jgi:hypothetical protein
VKFLSGSVSKSSVNPAEIELTDALNGQGILHLQTTDTSAFESCQRYSFWAEKTPKHFTFACGRIKFRCL